MKRILKWSIIAGIIAAALVFGINALVVMTASENLVDDYKSADDIVFEEGKRADCILVLGAEVKSDGSPSHMLRDRLDKGIALYKEGVAPKILMSGDNGRVEYNEVKTMFQYARNAGVPAKDLFLDHAGFSTYESMYRAKDVFEAERVVVVTQKYHEYRALYIGSKLGLSVKGVSAADISYVGDGYREVREVLARDKDFVKCIYKPEPTFLGDTINIKGDGGKTQ